MPGARRPRAIAAAGPLPKRRNCAAKGGARSGITTRWDALGCCAPGSRSGSPRRIRWTIGVLFPRVCSRGPCGRRGASTSPGAARSAAVRPQGPRLPRAGSIQEPLAAPRAPREQRLRRCRAWMPGHRSARRAARRTRWTSSSSISKPWHSAPVSLNTSKLFRSPYAVLALAGFAVNSARAAHAAIRAAKRADQRVVLMGGSPPLPLVGLREAGMSASGSGMTIPASLARDP